VLFFLRETCETFRHFIPRQRIPVPSASRLPSLFEQLFCTIDVIFQISLSAKEKEEKFATNEYQELLDLKDVR